MMSTHEISEPLLGVLGSRENRGEKEGSRDNWGKNAKEQGENDIEFREHGKII